VSKVQNVFWSGGFDGTFVVLKYLRQGIDVQPYYSMPGYGYQKAELETIERIRQAVRNIPSLTGELRQPILFYPQKDIGYLPKEYQDAYWEIWKEPKHW